VADRIGGDLTRPSDVEALKHLALLGALDGPVEVSSGEFATLLGLSQQTASRRLIELADAGLVGREMGLRKQRVHITDAGRALLQAEHLLYRRLFEHQDKIVIAGRVASGLGEGRYYLTRAGYTSQFVAKLGWTPYPGTLNLELPAGEAQKIAFLRRSPQHLIEGFTAEGRSFGAVTCHGADVGGHACAAILPHRTHHTTTLELIAPVRLRDAIPCNDGDLLEVTVFLRGSGEVHVPESPGPAAPAARAQALPGVSRGGA
jgi:riboflavin kinase